MSGNSVSRFSLILALGAGLVAAAPVGAETAAAAPNLAACEQMLAKGDQARGVPCLRAGLKALAAGPDDAKTLTAYREWAEAFLRSRDAATAKALFEEALVTKAAQKPSTALGLLHFFYSYLLLQHTPDTAASLDHARKALEILERTAGPEAYDTISARDNLASQLTTTGAVAPGLNLAEANFDIALKALGEDEPLTWRVSNNFAEALRSIGRPEAAVPIDRVLLKKRAAHYGDASIQALASASNLALNYLAMGDKEQALKYFRAQGYYAQKLGDRTSEHVEQATAWIVYTNILFSPDAQLKPQELEALMGFKDWKGAPDLLRVKATQLAAAQYEKQGKIRQGLALRQTAYDISVASFGARDPTTFDALLGVAQAHVRNQETDKALEVFRTLDHQLYDWTLREIGTAGNRYIAETTRVLADNFLFAFGRFALEQESARAPFADALSRWKTMESGERTRLRQMVDTLPDDVKPQAQEVIRLLGRQQEVLSEQRTAAERATDAALVRQLKEKSEALATRLQALPAQAPTPLGTQIDAILTPKDAVINFAVITQRQGTRSSAKAIEDQRLLAVVRRAGAAPAVVDLGDFRDILGRVKRAGEDGDVSAELHGILFGKLASQLAGAERLYIVPDAALYSISFALLRDGKGGYLDQAYEVHLLTREDGMLTLARHDRLVAGGKAVLAGGLDFSSGKEKGPRALPASGREASEVNTILTGTGYSTRLLTGRSGTEAALKAALPGASVVHLATHGFFEPPHDDLSALWRAGLVLAGAGTEKPPKPDGADGYLYAEELMDWDLSAADLVVLSACETALGDSSSVSAIRGLPTALSIAGARRSILTLWPVDDAGAANFMVAFYRHAAEPGATYAQALRRTRLDAIAGKIPNAASPQLWASFVMFEG